MLPPHEFPPAFHGLGQHMLHPRIAIWSHLKNDFQVYQVNDEAWPAIQLIPTNTERTTPFYFAEGPGDHQSRTFTVYRRRALLHSHVNMAIWHTGGWLCRRAGGRLEAALPILSVSDPKKLQWESNVGLVKDGLFEGWLYFQTPSFYRSIIHNRIHAEPIEATQPTQPTIPTVSLPLFVAEALLDKAERAREECAIAMEPLRKGEAAVTSCFHVFQRDALDTWFRTNTTCPVCKATCAITNC
jgi:hypothetical protein